MKSDVRVRVFHQIDPGGAVTGGIDSVIRGIAKWAPNDIRIDIVGLTMDPVARPVGRWTTVQIGDKAVRFYAVGRHNTPMHRSAMPLSVRLTVGILRHWHDVTQACDVLEFHRIEPTLPFVFDSRHKNAFVHQNMEALYNPKSDIGWKRLPWLYFALERLVMPRLQSVFGVRQDAIAAYKERYPAIAGRFQFIPTWMDPELFRPATSGDRDALRRQLLAQFDFPQDAFVVISVGRLDNQKNPMLAMATMARLVALRPNAYLVWIGDGTLRESVQTEIERLELGGHVVLAGLKTPVDIARALQAADVFLMTSAYEGMPISVLEALACGLAIVSTNVGELPQIVKEGVNGFLVGNVDADKLAAALDAVCITGPASFRPAALDSVSPYVPAKVLTPVFSQYRVAAERPRP